MTVITRVVDWVKSLFSKKSIEEVYGMELAITPLMLRQQEIYRGIMRGTAPWNNSETPGLMLASAVCSETARKVTLEFSSGITGSARADYLNEQYRGVKNILRNSVQAACGNGEVIFKPYIADGGINVTASEPSCYFPLRYDGNGDLTDVVFGAVTRVEKQLYKLLERHTYNRKDKTHAITYKAYRSTVPTNLKFNNAENIGTPVNIAEVPEWAHLRDITIYNIESPLYVLFKMPETDSIETPQRQGLPIYSRAVELLKKADEQEALTRREFILGKAKIFASAELFRKSAGKKGGAAEYEFPEDKDIFVSMPGIDPEGAPITIFNPEFRFNSLDARTNQLLRRIELLCGMSYGVISDINTQDKTAEEIRASKDRFYTTVADIQTELQKALDHLIQSLNVLADLQGIPQGDYDVTYTWDDSIVSDRVREFSERMQLVTAGILSRPEMRGWYLNIDADSEEARNIPTAEADDSEFR